MTNANLPLSSVDTLGELLARIAELTAKADAIKSELKDQTSLVEFNDKGIQRLDVEGTLFKAVCTGTNRCDTDTKKLYADFGITEEVLANYKKAPIAVYTVKVTSR
jgi:hypothetical protein